MTKAATDYTINTTDSLKQKHWLDDTFHSRLPTQFYVFRALIFAEIIGYHQTGCSRQDTGVDETTSCRNDLTFLEPKMVKSAPDRFMQGISAGNFVERILDWEKNTQYMTVT